MQKRFRTITLAFILSFVTISVLSFYSIKQFSSLINYSNEVDRTNEVITHLHTAKDVLREFDRRERDYMILRDSNFLSGHNKRVIQLDKTLRALKGLIKDNNEQLQTLVLLRTALTDRISYFRKNVAYMDTSRSTVVSVYYIEGDKAKDECYTLMDKMLDKEKGLLDARFYHKRHFEYLASSTTGILLIIFFILTVGLFFLMIFELKQKIRYEEELQTQLIDLENSHAELEQIAFAASHDMQEPLRKIKIFGDRLLWIGKGSADEELKMSVERISQAADEVQELTEEIIKLANLVKSRNFEEDVNIRKLINDIIAQRQTDIDAKGAVFTISALPELTADAEQLKLLFDHLISNALKFTRDKVPPKININGTITTGDEIAGINDANRMKRFYRIQVTDNGIGFDNKFIGKIFKVFQRLHNDDAPYVGKGIGLAICQRIMINHKGFITASGMLNSGASFAVYFPMEGQA